MIPSRRCVCAVCGKKLFGPEGPEDLIASTADGAVVLTCSDHAAQGEAMVNRLAEKGKDQP